MNLKDFLIHLSLLNISLYLDGNRLRYKAPPGAITPELKQDLLERKAEIIEFLQKIKVAPPSNQTPIVSIYRNENQPLSFAQQRLWFLDQLEPISMLYILPAVYRFSGSLNISALERSLQEIVRRHEALRTTFRSEGGQPSQVINTHCDFLLTVLDLRSRSVTEREAEVQRLVDEETQHIFDLSAGPLIRAKLLHLGNQEFVLVVTMHHIISDGWSMGVFRRELTTLYQAFILNQPSPLPELSVQYADFAHWQRQWFQGEVLEAQLDYWRTQLKNVPPILELPVDYPRPLQTSYQGAQKEVILPEALVEALKQLSQEEGVTLFMTLLAAFSTLLYRYTGQEDIVIGSPIANRNRSEIEDLIGFFVNTLVLRTDLVGTPNFRELLKRVREVTLGAYAHQDIPFEKLVEELKPERNQGCSPLFQVMFVLQNMPTSILELPNLHISTQSIDLRTAMFDLTLVLRETTEGLSGFLEYSTDLFAPETIGRMIDHFQILLKGIVADPNQSIATLPILTEAEQQKLLVKWNNTQIDYPKAKCIHQLFESRAKKTPDATAVIFEDQNLTYRELDSRANQLANYLRSQGIGTESLIGICIERSLEMIVGILGILKAGGAYVPLDPLYPKERLAFILSDSQASVLLTQKHLAPIFLEAKAKVIYIDEDWEKISETRQEDLILQEMPENLAYIIYTSGSTGNPKGVMIQHRSLVNFVTAAAVEYQITQDDRILQFASISFDAAIEEIFCCLSYGATLILRTDELLGSVSKFLHKCQDWKLTVLDLPTAYWHQLISELADNNLNLPDSIRLVIIGGERALPEKVKLWQEHSATYAKLVNSYGPTEATVVATVFRLTTSDTHSGVEVSNLPIGRPIGNVQLYVLDKFLQPVPVGISGELHIGGLGLARGYLNRPDLTKEKFIPSPFSNELSSHLYKTGDLARYLPDGNIEFIGRIDNQVKIRGFRIELGEIEQLLSQHPAISHCVVVAQEDDLGDKRLVAYVVPNGNQVTSAELRKFLQQKLPDYMLPFAFVTLEALPLTPNNKIDYRALPKPNYQDVKTDQPFVEPQDELEIQLVNIWEKLLGIQPISVQDNFFDLGGHSLLAVRLFAEVEKVFGKNLPLATLFQAATVKELANIIRQQNWLAPWSSLVPMQPKGSKLPLFYMHAGGGNLLVYRELASSLGSDQPVYGLQPKGLDGKFDPFQTIEDMADYYLAQILKVQPEGPYFLAGLSSGGTIALEIAQRLYASGQKVALLAMFDTVGPDYYKSLPLVPRLVSVLSWFIADWFRRISSWSQKIIRLVSQDGWSKTYRLILERIGFVQPNIDADAEIQMLRTRTVIETEIREYQVQAENWLDKLVNTFLIFLLKNSSTPFYAGIFARGLTDQSIDVLPESLFKIQEANRAASDSYIPKPYRGPITYFRASESPPGLRPSPKGGWDNIAIGEMEIYTIPGNHTSIMKSTILAEKLKASLEKAQTDSSGHDIVPYEDRVKSLN